MEKVVAMRGGNLSYSLIERELRCIALNLCKAGMVRMGAWPFVAGSPVDVMAKGASVR